MGIQINGQTDTVTSTTAGGSVKVTPLAASTGLNVGTGASISSPATNILTLGTNNSERVRIGSTGSVGIGTNESYGDSNASFTSLSLGGNGTRYGLIELNKSDGIAGSWIDCYGTGGNGDLRITTAGTSGAITFWTGGEFTEKVRISSSGYVGIGSATPAFQLTVDQGTTDGNLFDLKNEEVRLITGVWGTGSTYPREITLNATRFDSGTVPALRLAGQGGIKFAVDLNTVRMEIDSSGRVTMPYQPYARASSTSLVSSGNAIPLNSYNLSRGGITISGNRFTVPVAGAYVFGYHHLGNSGSGACQVEIRHNGTYVSGTRTQDTNSSNDSFGTQTVKELAASDYIEFWVIQGATHNNTDYNSMWIWLIG